MLNLVSLALIIAEICAFIQTENQREDRQMVRHTNRKTDRESRFVEITKEIDRQI